MGGGGGGWLEGGGGGRRGGVEAGCLDRDHGACSNKAEILKKKRKKGKERQAITSSILSRWSVPVLRL